MKKDKEEYCYFISYSCYKDKQKKFSFFILTTFTKITTRQHIIQIINKLKENEEITNIKILKIILEWKAENNMQELEKLENRLFLLEMTDRWEAKDYTIAKELRKKIKDLKENGKIE